jgi:hypothetical protein
VRRLLNHPFLRMNKLQEALAKFQSDINAGAAVVSDYLKCLQTICDTIGAIGTAFANISQADIGKEIANYTTNFVAKSGQVLTEGQKVKVQQVQATITEIKALSTDVVADAQAVSP